MKNNYFTMGPRFEGHRIGEHFQNIDETCCLCFFRLKREGSSSHISHFVPIEFGYHF